MTTEEALLMTIETMKEAVENQSRQMSVLLSQNAEMSQQIKELTAQLAWFRRRYFGRSSEKHLDLDNQPSLFDAAGIEIPTDTAIVVEDEPQDESAADDNTAKKRKSVPRPRQTWDNLPVLKTIVIEPEGVDLSRYRRMGEETTYLVEKEPGKLYRVAYVRVKYGLIDPTEPVEKGKGVIIAPMPLFPINKGIPGPTLLADVLLQKYEYHMPFYRQIKQLAHLGMAGVKEATMTGWFRQTMELLAPLHKALMAEILKYDYCQADESTVPVINPEAHQADKEYVWMIRAVLGGLVAFFYKVGSRAGDVIKEQTDKYNYKGYLQCDGWTAYPAAYKASPDVSLVNCMVHIRRSFEQALDENRKAASWFLAKIKEIYRIEHECDLAGMTPEQRKVHRNLKTRPIMVEMKNWMEKDGLCYSGKTQIGKAVTYAYTRWDNMMKVLDDGRLLWDNNLAENEIRPITLGRKNYLFCGNHEAAGNMCIIASLLATCRNHDVNPRLYLEDIIAKMPYKNKATTEDLVELLPHKWKLQHPEAVMEKVRNLAK